MTPHTPCRTYLHWGLVVILRVCWDRHKSWDVIIFSCLSYLNGFPIIFDREERGGVADNTVWWLKKSILHACCDAENGLIYK